MTLRADHIWCIHTCQLLQSCPTLWDAMDHSMSGSSVHGISQARILEWVTISPSRGSSQPRDQKYWSVDSYVSYSSRGVLYHLHHLENQWFTSQCWLYGEVPSGLLQFFLSPPSRRVALCGSMQTSQQKHSQAFCLITALSFRELLPLSGSPLKYEGSVHSFLFRDSFEQGHVCFLNGQG